jgi:hypothetical protein
MADTLLELSGDLAGADEALGRVAALYGCHFSRRPSGRPGVKVLCVRSTRQDPYFVALRVPAIVNALRRCGLRVEWL